MPPADLDRSGAENDSMLVIMWLREQRSKHTRRAYTGDINDLMVHLNGLGKTLRSVTFADLQSWVITLTGAVASRARRISAMKSLFTFGQELGYLVFNMGKPIKPPKIPNQLAERILTEDEIDALAMAADSPKAKGIVMFLYGSGCRVDELCKLQWKHIHDIGNGQTVVTLNGKGDKTRHVTMNSEFIKVLEPLRGEDEDFVFRTNTGHAMHPTQARRTLKDVAEKAQLKHSPSPHWLRHSYASHALQRGANPSLLQANLGHKSLETTGRYLHVQPKDGAGLYLKVPKTK